MFLFNLGIEIVFTLQDMECCGCISMSFRFIELLNDCANDTVKINYIFQMFLTALIKLRSIENKLGISCQLTE